MGSWWTSVSAHLFLSLHLLKTVYSCSKEGAIAMRPQFKTRYSQWLSCMLPLAIGCVFGAVWGSNLDSTVVLSSSTFSLSETQHHHHLPGAQHNPPSIAIYRSPAPLRGGHGEFLPSSSFIQGIQTVDWAGSWEKCCFSKCLWKSLPTFQVCIIKFAGWSVYLLGYLKVPMFAYHACVGVPMCPGVWIHINV